MRHKKARALVEESVGRGEYCYCLEPMQFLFYTTSFKSYSSVFWVFFVVIFFLYSGNSLLLLSCLTETWSKLTGYHALVFNRREGERERRLESSNVINLPVSISSPLLHSSSFPVLLKEKNN